MNDLLFQILAFLLDDRAKHGDAYSARYAAQFLVDLQENKQAVADAVAAALSSQPAPKPLTAADVAAALAQQPGFQDAISKALTPPAPVAVTPAKK